jgi:Fe-S oxidoreductase
MSFGWEQGVLALLIVGSAALFVRTFSRKLALVAAGAPDRPRTDHAGRRLARTLREVLIQTKVIGGRPVVGALHAVVFFGFLLFALETLDHFAHGFGVSLLEPLFGPAYPAWRALMTAVAVLVSVAILGLAFRRFVLVKSSPDPKSWTSAVVALFILVLMLTYLNGVREVPFAPRANWWVHALVILAFPHLILKSKHFHIILAPVSIFLRLDRLGDYASLDLEKLMEESEGDAEISLGLEAVKDLPWKMRLDFFSCVECKRCTSQCPAALAGNTLDPRGFILAGRRTLAEAQPTDAVIGRVIGDDALGVCVTCGACENVCPVGVEHLQVLVGAKRAQALASGRGVVAVDFFHAIESTGNAFAEPKGERRTLLDEMELPRFTGAAGEWVLWLGCVWGFNRDQRPAVAAFKQLLDAAQVPYGVLDEEVCCGHHSRRQGEEAQYQDLARRTLELLHAKGVRRIVTPCPHCLHTIKREHAQLNGEAAIEIVHHSELLARLAADRRLPLRAGNGEGAVAVYHDPCYLARFEEVTGPPRAALAAAGVALRELPHERRKTLCCGGGAAGFVRESKGGRRVDQPRREEIAASGATLLVTACPECRMMLDASVEKTKDIAEILAASLALPLPKEQPQVGGPSATGPDVGEGGTMYRPIEDDPELEARILQMFEHHPDEELQLLDIAGKAHVSCKLCDLRHAADHLVEEGQLCLCRHGGGRYYKLDEHEGKEQHA